MPSPTPKLKRSVLTLWRELVRLPSTVCIVLIGLYRAILSPSVGILRYLSFYPRPSCIFYPTCSQYGIECFTKYSFWTALQKTANRIGRCHSENEPRVDLS